MKKGKRPSTKRSIEDERRSRWERRAYEIRFLGMNSLAQTADILNDELEADGMKAISAPTVWRWAEKHRAYIRSIEDASLDVKRGNRVALLDQITAAALKLAASDEATIGERTAALAQATRSQQAAILVEGSAAPVKTEAKVEVTMVDAKDLELARMLDVAPAGNTIVVHEGESA